MEILLKKQELLDLGRGLQGVRITCSEGLCWLTQSGDSRDIILSGNENFIIRTDGHVIITATEACRIMMATCTTEEKPGDPIRSVARMFKSYRTRPFGTNLS